MVTLPIKDTRARLADGGELHTVIDAKCVPERKIFWLCLEIGMMIKLSEPLLLQLSQGHASIRGIG